MTKRSFRVMVSFSSLLLSALTVTSIGAAPQQLEVDVDFRPNAELVCYECARTPDNDTCAIGLENLPKVTAVGQVNNLKLSMFVEVRFGDLDTKHEFNIFLKASARIN